MLHNGCPGEAYNVGGRSERRNIDVVNTICAVLDELRPHSPHKPHASLITYVTDRPGHDRRYAINCSRIERELGWQPLVTFEAGIRNTVAWYLDHQDWVAAVTSGSYRHWIETQYVKRGGA